MQFGSLMSKTLAIGLLHHYCHVFNDGVSLWRVMQEEIVCVTGLDEVWGRIRRP